MAARQESLIRWAKYRELLDVGSKIGYSFWISWTLHYEWKCHLQIQYVEAAIENDGIVRTLKKITSVAKRSDELRNEGREEERLENTTEIVIDAQVTKMTHDILGAVVEIMDKTEISDDEFVSAIVRIYEAYIATHCHSYKNVNLFAESINWTQQRLGQIIKNCSKNVEDYYLFATVVRNIQWRNCDASKREDRKT